MSWKMFRGRELPIQRCTPMRYNGGKSCTREKVILAMVKLTTTRDSPPPSQKDWGSALGEAMNLGLPCILREPFIAVIIQGTRFLRRSLPLRLFSLHRYFSYFTISLCGETFMKEIRFFKQNGISCGLFPTR